LRGEPDAHGGNGGGANVAGSPGRGRNGGAGGINGDLTVVGVGNWPSDTTIGGRASRCTVGNNFFRQFSPCAIYSDQTGNFTASDWGAGGAGAELRDHARSLENVPITQTQIIRRGFKPGLAYRNNGGDGDPLDIIVLGPPKKMGNIVKCKVIGVLYLIDNFEQDDKLIAISENSNLEHINDIDELNEYYKGLLEIIEIWFTNYKGNDKIKSNGYGNSQRALNILANARDQFFSDY